MIRLVLRHGELVIGNLPDDDGNLQPFTVVEYIAASLAQDNLPFTFPLYKRIVDLALQHVGDEGFAAEKFFLNYPDPEINALTFDLVTDKEQLSRMHQVVKPTHMPDKAGLHQSALAEYVLSLAEHVVADYQLEIISREKKALMREMLDPNLIRDPEQYASVMNRYKEIKEAERRLSQQQGGRVVV